MRVATFAMSQDPHPSIEIEPRLIVHQRAQYSADISSLPANIDTVFDAIFLMLASVGLTR